MACKQLKLDLDGSQAASELIFELGNIVGRIDRGGIVAASEVSEMIEAAVERFETGSRDPAVVTLIRRIRELSQ